MTKMTVARLFLCQLFVHIIVSVPPLQHVHEYDHSLSMNTGLTWIDVYTTRCLSQISHVSDLITEKNIIHTCQANDFGHCLLSSRMSFKLDTHVLGSYYLCGAINIISGVTPQMYTAFITVHNGYVMLFEFLHFELSWTGKMCPRNRLSVSDDNGTIPREVYCGRRVPWTIISSGNKAVLRVITTGDTADISIFFSIQMISVVTQFSLQMVVFNNDEEVIHYTQTGVLDGESKRRDVIIKYTVMSKPSSAFKVLVDWVFTNDSSDFLRVYDGPGSLSAPISMLNEQFVSGTYVYFSSAYIVSIHHSSLYQELHVKFNNIMNSRNSDSKGCPSTSFLPNDKITGKLPSSYTISSPSTRPENTVCQINIVSQKHSKYYPIFHIRQFSFLGPTSMQYEVDVNCQYGGVYLTTYILGLDESHSVWNIYTGCDSEGTYVPAVLTSNGTTLTVLVSFFGGYSYGDFTGIVDFTLCKGLYVDCDDKPVLLPLVSPCFNIHISPPKYTESSYGNCMLDIKPNRQILGPSTLLLHFKNRLFFSREIFCNSSASLYITRIYNWPFNLNYNREHHLITDTDRFLLREAFLVDLHLEIPKCRYKKYDSYLTLNRASCQHVNYNSPDVTLIMDKTCWGKGEKFGAFLPETTQYLVMPSRNERAYILLYYDSSCPDECRNHTVHMIELNKEQRAVFNYTSHIAPDGHTYLQSNINYDGILLKIVPEFSVCQTYCRGTIYMSNHRIEEVKHAITGDALRNKDSDMLKKRRYLCSMY